MFMARWCLLSVGLTSFTIPKQKDVKEGGGRIECCGLCLGRSVLAVSKPLLERQVREHHALPSMFSKRSLTVGHGKMQGSLQVFESSLGTGDCS